mmetsp:Transcript_2681/g.6632  ORF Transcript_2681/g.6632 Transcript_2681/m.6632 type:complete len:207 (-) Transcript_2681:209-829(-)
MSHQVASLLPETVPVAEPPIASTCGKCSAVFFIAARIMSQWYSGSGFVTSHSVSIEHNTSLSFTATVLMSLLPKSKANRQPLASLPQTCFLSLGTGKSLALETILTGKGCDGVPQTLGMVLTSKAYLPSGENAFCMASQILGGPKSNNSEALRCQIISWMQTPARWIDASISSWESASTGNFPRAQPSKRGKAHSNVKGLPPTFFM